MSSSAAGSWSLSLGRWRGVEFRVHLHLPLLVLAVLLASSLPETLPATSQSQWPALNVRSGAIGLVVLVVSVLLHELARAAVARRVGGRTNLIVLGPIGGWTQPQLPSDPPAHLVTSLAGPLTYLALLVAAACGLAMTGEHNILHLLRPFDPEFIENDSLLHQAAQLAVWINAWLLLANMLPIQPCDGAEVLRGVLWPLVGRTSASAALAHFAYGAAAVTAVLAAVLQRQMVNDFLPAWFPLSVIAVLLLYGGSRAARQRRYDVGLDIDELESDDEQWLNAEWLDGEQRTAVLVEHIQEKQQEALDRKRRQREDREDARVDDILARLQNLRFDELSEEEQAVLKRASRRYRQRREQADGV